MQNSSSKVPSIKKTKMESINWFQTTYQVHQKHRHGIVFWPSVSMKSFKHHSEVLSHVRAERTIGSLTKDVFERRTSTGSEAFFLFICLGTNKFVLLSFFSLIKTIYQRVSTKPLPNDAKSPLPVDVRRAKTPLLKLPNIRDLKYDDEDINENWQNNDTARPSSFFVYFFAVTARLRRKNASRILRLSFRIQLHKNCLLLTN